MSMTNVKRVARRAAIAAYGENIEISEYGNGYIIDAPTGCYKQSYALLCSSAYMEDRNLLYLAKQIKVGFKDNDPTNLLPDNIVLLHDDVVKPVKSHVKWLSKPIIEHIIENLLGKLDDLKVERATNSITFSTGGVVRGIYYTDFLKYYRLESSATLNEALLTDKIFSLAEGSAFHYKLVNYLLKRMPRDVRSEYTVVVDVENNECIVKWKKYSKTFTLANVVYSCGNNLNTIVTGNVVFKDDDNANYNPNNLVLEP